MKIRLLHNSDLASVAEIESQSPSPWKLSSLQQEISRPLGKQYVFVQDDDLVAWVALQIIGTEAELLKIAVHKNWRCKGIGFRFLRGVQNSLYQEGVRQIFLEVRQQNSAAISLYEKIGFQQIGVRESYYRDPVDDALIFKLDIVYTGD